MTNIIEGKKVVEKGAENMNDEMSGYKRKMALLGEKMLAEEEGNLTADTDINTVIEREREKSLRENQHIQHEFQ